MPKRELDWSDFKGVPRLPKPRYTPVPDILFDVYMPALGEAELRVLLYIIRHTLGWKKDADRISLRQLTDGQQRRDGTWQDYGAGLSKRSVMRAVKGLEEKGLIWVDREQALKGDSSVNVYRIRFEDEGG